MPSLGDAFFFAVERSHLWVVITDPDGDRGKFVMVNFTTLNDNIVDESCVLGPIDYPRYITHPTVVNYIDAQLWWSEGEKGFDELHAVGEIKPMAPLSNKTLLRVQQGALVSEFFPPDYRPLVIDNLVPVSASEVPPPPKARIPPRSASGSKSKPLSSE